MSVYRECTAGDLRAGSCRSVTHTGALRVMSAASDGVRVRLRFWYRVDGWLWLFPKARTYSTGTRCWAITFGERGGS